MESLGAGHKPTSSRHGSDGIEAAGRQSSPEKKQDRISIEHPRKPDPTVRIGGTKNGPSSTRDCNAQPCQGSSALDATTPITYLYLTFETQLPEPNASSRTFSSSTVPAADLLPPSPDLRHFTNPHQWPSARKNIMLALSCIATMLTAYSAGAYSPPIGLMTDEFQASRTAVACGITLFTVGFAFAPMVLAPFSEINGRYPVFVAAGIVYVVFQGVCGVVPGLAGMLVARFMNGVGGSVFSTMVGGTIADLWAKEERNTPMALFSGAVLVGTGLGPLAASVMVERWGGDGIVGPGALWRWVFWHQVIADGVVVIAIICLFKESRACVLLSRKATILNRWYDALEEKGVFGVWVDRDAGIEVVASSVSEPSVLVEDEEKGIPLQTVSDDEDIAIRGLRLQRIRWRVREDEQHESISKMIAVSLFRPFHLLFTEPVVFFFSLWVSFAWAVLYLTFGSVPLVYSRQYGFNIEQSGYIFSAMIIGSLIATTVGILQESILSHPDWQPKAEDDAQSSSGWSGWAFVRRHFPVEAPEARLYFTCITSVFLPIGLYIFGFAAQPDIHWIVPAIAVGFATMGIYTIYLATFNYLADSYQSYASSALAAQSFCRNILGGSFPLVVTPLFTNLGEDAAAGLLGSIATALTVVPWVLAIHGEKIRRRSRFAVSLGEA